MCRVVEVVPLGFFFFFRLEGGVGSGKLLSSTFKNRNIASAMFYVLWFFSVIICSIPSFLVSLCIPVFSVFLFGPTYISVQSGGFEREITCVCMCLTCTIGFRTVPYKK